VDQLVGTREIAERLGSKRPTFVHDLRRRHPDFPEPIATVSAVLVWDWPDIEAWAKKTGRPTLPRPIREQARADHMFWRLIEEGLSVDDVLAWWEYSGAVSGTGKTPRELWRDGKFEKVERAAEAVSSARA
jgi:predicted DNA-binding transcriptional regulator AlpA